MFKIALAGVIGLALLGQQAHAQTRTVARIYINTNLADGVLADENCGTSGNFERVKAANRRLGLSEISVGNVDSQIEAVHGERMNLANQGKAEWCAHWTDVLKELEETPTTE